MIISNETISRALIIVIRNQQNKKKICYSVIFFFILVIIFTNPSNEILRTILYKLLIRTRRVQQ